MLERGILRSEVKHAIDNGIIIEEYQDDKPHPSFLVAYVGVDKPLHVVVAKKEQELYVITAYIPDTQHFEKDLITRNKDEY